MTSTPEQPNRIDRIEEILTRVAEQQERNTDALADLTNNVTRVLGRSAILDDVLLELRDSHEELRDSHEELKRDFLENQRTTNAALNQLSAILVQLTRINPQN